MFSYFWINVQTFLYDLTELILDHCQYCLIFMDDNFVLFTIWESMIFFAMSGGLGDVG
jgi:hypothetical protein